nr:T-complex protein 1 subunit beta [Tanacetum cinerariifolium]
MAKMRECRQKRSNAGENARMPTKTRKSYENTRKASFVGALAIADLVKTTLGPMGMDKILQSTGRGHSVTVTNDDATILKSRHIDNPAAKVK